MLKIKLHLKGELVAYAEGKERFSVYVPGGGNYWRQTRKETIAIMDAEIERLRNRETVRAAAEALIADERKRCNPAAPEAVRGMDELYAAAAARSDVLREKPKTETPDLTAVVQKIAVPKPKTPILILVWAALAALLLFFWLRY